MPYIVIVNEFRYTRSVQLKTSHKMKWVPVFMLIMVHSLFQSVCSCPSHVCICKWKGGKQSVECGGRLLPGLPDGMDPSTQVLNFTGNAIQVLQNERFLKMDLINLQKIFLSRNQIIRIHEKAFKGLSNLVELDLAENMLTTIPTDTFQDYSSLMRLALNGNPIRELKSSAFKHLTFLTTLELSNCQIDRIEDEAFFGMDNLEWLRLDSNRIATIQGSNILPKSLHGISLHGNRWTCDCRLVDMHRWLLGNAVPHTEEPKCVTPTRLANRFIKTLDIDELACMPDITPSTLYLEIAEGRNISLSCKINAIPEAVISWWYQGQVLQNDSLLTSNFHLYYYSEDGGEEKHSQLFINNANVEDNGTFACIAENPAGRIQANYTIRVIVKEEPIVEQIALPYEYFLVIIAGAGCMGVIFLIIICILMCKCRQRGKRRKTNGTNGKDITLPRNSGSGSGNVGVSQMKGSVTINDNRDQLTINCSGPKMNGTVCLNPQDMMVYVPNSGQSIQTEHGMSSVLLNSQYCSPPALRNYQEQNPDLINDAESVNKTRRSESEHDAEECGSSGPNSLQGSVQGLCMTEKLIDMQIKAAPSRFNGMSTLPRNMTREMYQHQADVHLSPGCFLSPDGYPIEFGIPKMIPIMAATNSQVNFYKTLPHKRVAKLQSAVNPGARYSREAEFLSRVTPVVTYDAYDAYAVGDVRYTIEGYPVSANGETILNGASGGLKTNTNNFPSPPDGYKSDAPQMSTASIAFHPTQSQQQWPSCLPGYHAQIAPIKMTSHHELKRITSPLLSPSGVVTKRCVGAQTSDHENDTIPEGGEDEECDGSDENGESKMRQLTGPLADSPDEGYVGDSHEGSDM